MRTSPTRPSAMARLSGRHQHRDVPQHRRGLHEGAGERDQQADPEQAEVAVAEGDEHRGSALTTVQPSRRNGFRCAGDTPATLLRRCVTGKRFRRIEWRAVPMAFAGVGPREQIPECHSPCAQPHRRSLACSSPSSAAAQDAPRPDPAHARSGAGGQAAGAGRGSPGRADPRLLRRRGAAQGVGGAEDRRADGRVGGGAAAHPPPTRRRRASSPMPCTSRCR